MKYLKNFYNKLKYNELKKYIVAEVSHNTVYILQTNKYIRFGDNKGNYKFDIIYEYKIDSGIIKKIDYNLSKSMDLMSKSEEKIMKVIVLQSDSLDECLKYLNFRKEVNNYNL